MPSLKELPVRPLTAAEKALVSKIDQTWDRARALAELKSGLQTAIEIELATLPIYLFTYYSINRTPTGFPSSDVARFADEAGGVIMSVAVEEMLHMSLSSNILYSLAVMPQLYLHSPWPYPTNLPGHERLGPDGKPLAIPLAKFSMAQLWQFLEIEYPATSDAPPESGNWKTIGQIYSFLRCIISSRHITDADFRQGKSTRQIQSDNYSADNIDTVFPNASFNNTCPIPAPAQGSAADVAVYPNDEDSHAGYSELIVIDSRERAMQAIGTIDAQGEGFGSWKFDDLSHRELSHYYKFLTLQSQLVGYDPNDEKLPKEPTPPPPAKRQFSTAELATFVYALPDNPVAANYPAGPRALADICSGLYQYMLILTESIFLQPPAQQKLFFNQAIHRSMIWILDKLIQAMVTASGVPGGVLLAPSFENINLGTRNQAFGNLVKMCTDMDAKYGKEPWYTADAIYYVDMIPSLTDVSKLWGATGEPVATESAQAAQPSPALSDDVKQTAKAAEAVKAAKTNPRKRPPGGCDVSKYKGIPKFPSKPPNPVAPGEARHACMGLNECKGQGRTRDNACAGQGYCSTAMAYSFSDPPNPGQSDHTCHVKNACAGQGGCGLYGSTEELNRPGMNKCATLGSCATPINAERFTTDGPNQGKSVWLRARELFTEKTWPMLRQRNPSLPAKPPLPHPELFQYGPTIEWIQDYSGEGMTACGASGMSGAGSCA